MCLTDYIYFHPQLPKYYNEGDLSRIRADAENNEYLAAKFENLCIFQKDKEVPIKEILQKFLKVLKTDQKS